MTGEERLSGLQLKIARARAHQDELRTALASFFATAPYKLDTRRDPDSRRLIYFLKQVSDPSPSLAVLAGEVLQALRSTLDHLAYRLVQIGTNNPGPFRHVYFPICDDAARYAAQKTAKTQGMCPGALAAIDACKPYRGGNDVLWRLDKLNNIDKHRLLITVGSAYQSVDIAQSLAAQMHGFSEEAKALMRGMQLFLKPADKMYPLTSGRELFADAPDAAETNMQFRFEVVLHEVGVCEGLSLIETLDEMLAEVERIVAGFLPHLS